MKDNSISHGIAGVAVSLGAITISLTELEQWLRITSLAVGIVIGILSAISVSFSLTRKLRNKKSP